MGEIFKIAAVEYSNENEKNILSTSGILLNDKYIITISTIINNNTINNKLIKPGLNSPDEVILNYNKLKVKENLRIFYKKDNCDNFTTKQGSILALYQSSYIGDSSNKKIFRDWTHNFDQLNTKLKNYNNNNISIVALSRFLIIQTENSANLPEFINFINDWCMLIRNEKIAQGDEIFIKSVAFGNKLLYNSYSQGIVSNLVGENSCFIVSDCPSTPGSEGSPVYKVNKKCNKMSSIPIGLVVSSLCWWRGEWTGLTLIIDIRRFLEELIQIEKSKITSPIPQSQLNELNCLKSTNCDYKNNKLLASIEYSAVQVYCGAMWGTGILINKGKGIFITNSHVVETDKTINLYWRGNKIEADLLYKTPDGEIYDLAILKCRKSKILDELKLKAINFCGKDAIINLGDIVFSLGFSLFSKNIKSNPTLSKGCVSQMNPFVIKTTCCVHAGSSGGAILNKWGELLGIIVCNIKLEENGAVYPRYNMAIPIDAIRNILDDFLNSHEDCSILKKLFMDNPKAKYAWLKFQAKL